MEQTEQILNLLCIRKDSGEQFLINFQDGARIRSPGIVLFCILPIHIPVLQ